MPGEGLSNYPGRQLIKVHISINIDKKTVIFDLDETLIHCNDSLDQPYDVKVKIRFPTG